MLRSWYLLGALAAIATGINALDAVPEEMSAKERAEAKRGKEPLTEEELLALDPFTQAACGAAANYKVSELPDFVDGSDNWPCSYAGTLPSD